MELRQKNLAKEAKGHIAYPSKSRQQFSPHTVHILTSFPMCIHDLSRDLDKMLLLPHHKGYGVAGESGFGTGSYFQYNKPLDRFQHSRSTVCS